MFLKLDNIQTNEPVPHDQGSVYRNSSPSLQSFVYPMYQRDQSFEIHGALYR
jgi:hypothetical protein